VNGERVIGWVEGGVSWGYEDVDWQLTQAPSSNQGHPNVLAPASDPSLKA